ncbi:Crp/Fnr family transcriptional regulator [Filimonas lacunae]|nr:Crp/Fnr family transcriptional regulator [Filimonas lacunae]
MFEVFLQKFNEKVKLTPEEEAWVVQQLTPKKLLKKQYLLQEGEVCKQVVFVEKGALRAFVLDGKGNEHITAFALEGWTMGDLCSFMKEEPGTLNIQALEDCDLLLISKAAHDLLLQTQPKYEIYFRILMTEGYMALQRRTTNLISLSLEQQYKAFTETYPNIVQRVPQHMIASHMGLKPETLSRIRSRMNADKESKSID